MRSDTLELVAGTALTCDRGDATPSFRVASDATLLLFLVDLAAPASLAGTVSGR